MEKQVSNYKSLNSREGIIGLLIMVASALLGLVWTGLTPVVEEFQLTQTFDFSPFLEAVNFNTAWQLALATVLPYFGVIFYTGEKKK